ncbi:DUF3053 family protein [Pragia fontium]|uniref:DUF3053 domain-containing protein n=2 Tax=Pragia fontium TaxID=82985 RepID=A0AAJ4WCG6_9GAMM|nr:DUF3053 family protein [Pragia fontium]AKJ43611.1 hypothetical protein QQ39_17410 [Pragia fontium]SFD20542.1 Protein of unknown function [Pragia fontium DSM 5563 = ATCC 49100]SUB84106.1 Protein of uncharacterised function (DUF3053) [Pragia fontium]VEJ56998.1 Protein of uncharacterised function (DUF3053) [Pragia fontium]GKX64310.1 hypothetical protein SOASR032_28790 [Pragia fontium]
MSLVKQKTWARFLAPLFVLGLVFQLAGCGDNEPEQRKAFSEFLQTKIIDGSKVRLPALTEEQKKEFGNYSKDYELLTGFTDQLNAAFSKSMESSMNELRTLNSMKAMVDNRDKVEKAQAETKAVQAKLDEIIKTTGDQYTALKMPEDLKAVYDKAYAKVVTQQGDLGKQTLVLLDSTFDDILKISDFLKAQGDKIEYSGQMVQFTEQKALDQFNEMNNSLQKNQQELMNVARKIAQLM